MTNPMAGFLIGFDPVAEAQVHGFVPLEDVVVVVLTTGGLTLPEPAITARWPVHVEEFSSLSSAAAFLGIGNVPKPYVLCGLASAVVLGLRELHDALHSWPPPLYVVTDETKQPSSPTGGFYASDPYGHPHGAPRFVRHLAAPSLAYMQWEEAVAVVCAAHITSVPQMILNRARRHPRCVAIRGDRGWGAGRLSRGVGLESVASAVDFEVLTYAELCNRAWVLGDELNKRFGVVANSDGDQKVGVTLPPSPLSPVCFLALGMRGLCAVNIAPTPPELRAYQLEKVKCQVVLALAPAGTPKDVLAGFDEIGDAPRTIYIDRLWQVLFGDGKGHLPVTSTAIAAGETTVLTNEDREEEALAHVQCASGASVLRSAALVEWTSGSTGKPKAMAVAQWRLSHWLRWRIYHFPFEQYGRIVGVGLFWLWYWHLPLCQGGEIVVIPSYLAVDVRGMVSRLHELKVDWVDCLSPGQLNMLVELVDERDFPTLPFKHVMSSGEALPVAVAAAFLKRFPGTSIGNCLSTTETAADACCLKEIPLALCEAMLADEESIRMAKSAATDEIETPAVSYVPVLRMCADNFGTLRSDSVVWGNALGRAAESGERLLVKGWNVEPTGYLTDEDSNAFMPRQLASEVDRGDKAAASEDPLSSVVGCFYSGDRAVWRQFKGMGSDTYLCIEGRVDDVVKVRGHRVDLAGVEATLCGCALVVDCAALSHDDSVWACVVLKVGGRDGDETTTAAALRAISEHAARLLPPASCPVLRVVNAIPYGATGKKNRKRLAMEALPKASVDVAIDTKVSPTSRAPLASVPGHEVKSVGNITRRSSNNTDNVSGFPNAWSLVSIRAAFASQLGSQISDEDDFFECGGNSFKALRLCHSIGVPVANFFANSSVHALHRALVDTWQSGRSAVAASKQTTAPDAPPTTAGVLPTAETGGPLVCGMAVRLPGNVNSLNALWRHLEAGDDLLCTLPEKENDTKEEGNEIKMVHRKGVVNTEGAAAAFDASIYASTTSPASSLRDGTTTSSTGTSEGPLPPPAVFGRRLPVARSALMGTEARVLLEVCCSTLEDAGLDPFQMSTLHYDGPNGSGDKMKCGTFLCGGSLPHLPNDLATRASGEVCALHESGAKTSGRSDHSKPLDLNEFRRDDPAGYFAAEIGFDKDYLATTIAHALDLEGPAEVCQSACSSGLLAIARGVHAIRLGLCDLALCGGASFSPDETIRAMPGMVWSPDGICRPFSDEASGTVPADGAAVVLLVSPRAAAALYRQRDAPTSGGTNILKKEQDSSMEHGNAFLLRRPAYAQVSGVGLNNDGRRKSGFCQPSSKGQVECLQLALKDANLLPGDVDYVEAHGTGTRVGDPIELTALAQVFQDRQTRSARKHSPTSPLDDGSTTGYRIEEIPARKLLVGSAKGNIGHLNTASGAAGFVKACLVAHHGHAPPTAHLINHANLNKLVDWSSLPLEVVTKESHSGSVLASATPTLGRVETEASRMNCAGVSAFGIGGTNVHILLNATTTSDDYSSTSEAAANSQQLPRRPSLQLVSVASPSIATHFLAQLRAEADPRSAIDSFTFEQALLDRARCGALSTVGSSAVRAFQLVSTSAEPTSLPKALPAPVPLATAPRPVVLVFPGQGGAYEGMGRALLHADLLNSLDPASLSSILDAEVPWTSAESIVSVSLAVAEVISQHLADSTFKVSAVLGHSLGEWSAAAFTGAIARDKALSLARRRDLLVSELHRSLESQRSHGGGEIAIMVAVRTSAVELSAAPLGPLPSGLEISVVNGANAVVVGGLLPEQKLSAAAAKALGLSLKIDSKIVKEAKESADTKKNEDEKKDEDIDMEEESVGAWLQRLDAAGVGWRRVQASTAFHSPAVDPLCKPYEEALRSMTPLGLGDENNIGNSSASTFSVPLISTVNGKYVRSVTDNEANELSEDVVLSDPAYWARQIRAPVRFDLAMETVARDYPDALIIEVGPSALAGLIAANGKTLGAKWHVWPTIRKHRRDSNNSSSSSDNSDECATFLTCLGNLWAHGGPVPNLSAPRGKVSLPTYNFSLHYPIASSTSSTIFKKHRPQVIDSNAVEEFTDIVTNEAEEADTSPSPTTLYEVAWEVVVGGVATAAAPLLLPVVLLDFDDDVADVDSEKGTGAIAEAAAQEMHRRAVQYLSEIDLSAVAPRYKLIQAKDAAKAAANYGCLAMIGGLAPSISSLSNLSVEAHKSKGGDSASVSDAWGDASDASTVAVRAVKVLSALGKSATNEGSHNGPVDLFVLLQGAPRYSCVRGALRSARKEQPGLVIRCVTLRASSSVGPPCLSSNVSAKMQSNEIAESDWLSAQALLPALPMETSVDASGVIYMPRIVPLLPLNVEDADGDKTSRSSESSSSNSRASPSSGRVAVVSGGMRGLGLRVADALLKNGRADKVILLGRSLPADASASERPSHSGADASLLADILARGGEIAACDVCDWAAVSDLQTTLTSHEEVSIVVHCAGVVKDALLARTTDEDALNVLAPKVAGTLNLRRKWPQARFLGFSSSSAALGPAGQATYAGANAFIDEWLAWEKHEGGNEGVQSVQWGGWGGAGMSADLNISPLKGEKFFDISTGLAHLASILDSMGVHGDADKSLKHHDVNQRQQPVIPLPFALPAAVLAMDVEWPAYATNAMVSSPPEAGDNLLAHVIVPRAKTSRITSAEWTAGGWRSSSETQSNSYYMLAFGPGSDAINGTEKTCGWGCEERLELQHVVDRVPILPGSAYLCWALSALYHERALRKASSSSAYSLGKSGDNYHSASVVLLDVRFLKPLDLLIRRDCILTITFDTSGGSEASSGTLVIACGSIVHASMRFEALLSGNDSSISANSIALEAASSLCKNAKATCSAEHSREVSSPNEIFQSQGFGYGTTFSQLSQVRTYSGLAHASLEFATPSVSASETTSGVTFLTAGLVDSSLQLASLVDGGVMGVPSKIERFSWWPQDQQEDDGIDGKNEVVDTCNEDKMTAAVVLEEPTVEKGKSEALPTFQLSVCRAQRPVFYCSGLALFPLSPADDDNDEMGQFAIESSFRALGGPSTSLSSSSCVRIGVGHTPRGSHDDAFAHIVWLWEAASPLNGNGQGSVDAIATAEAAEMLSTVAATRPLSTVLLSLPPLKSDPTTTGVPNAEDNAAAKSHRISVDEAVGVLVAAARDLGLKAYVQSSVLETTTEANTKEEEINSLSVDDESKSEQLLWADGTMVEKDTSVATLPPVVAEPQAWDSPLVACVDATDSEKLEAGGAWFQTCDRKPTLRPHEVEVLATSWALNFRDVLVAQGAIPTDTAGAQLGIGGECGGVVARVGVGVKHVRAGDAVACVPPDGMGSYLVTRMEWVSPPLYRPTSYPSTKHPDATATSLLASSAQAAAAEVASHVAETPPLGGQEGKMSVWPDASGAASSTLAYATAWLALVDGPGRVKPCEVVLLHSAAGGVGLAALQLLQSRFVGGHGRSSQISPNIVVYGTASTESKRQLLLELGCRGAFDSRDPQAFSRGVRHAEAQRLSEEAQRLSDEAQRLSTAVKAAQASSEAAANAANSSTLSKLQRRTARAVGRARVAKAAAVRASAAAAQADKKMVNSSKDQHFEEDFEDVEGCVDVILGAVAGAAFHTSLSLLKPFGRFVELGKRSGYEKGSLPASVLLKGAALVAAHLDVLMLTDRPRAAKLFRSVWEAQQVPSHEGGLPPLPLDRVFLLSQLPESLKHMSQGTHVGKVVLVNGPNIGDVPCFAPQPKEMDKKTVIMDKMSRLTLKEVCSFAESDPLTATLRSLVARPPRSLQNKDEAENIFTEFEVTPRTEGTAKIADLAQTTQLNGIGIESASEDEGEDEDDDCYAESDSETDEDSASREIASENQGRPVFLKAGVLPRLTSKAAASLLLANSNDQEPVNLLIAGSRAAAAWADVTLRRRAQQRLTGQEGSSGDGNATLPLLVVRVQHQDWVKISVKELQSTLVLAATNNGERASKVLLVPSATASREHGGRGGHNKESDEVMSSEDLAAAMVERETWLRQAVSGLAGVSPNDIDREEPFEELGVDSLAQINLARRVGARFNLHGFGVGDLLKHNTISSLLAYTEERVAVRVKPAAPSLPPPSLTVTSDSQSDHASTSSKSDSLVDEERSAEMPVPPITPLPAATHGLRHIKGRVLCLHGFRSNGEMLQVAMAPLLASVASSCKSISYEFLDAPHSSNGDPEPGIPSEVPTYEWWGIPHHSTYDDGWQQFGPRALFQESREKVLAVALNPAAMLEKGPVVGLIGFSQGAAMCVALASDPQARPQLPSLQFVGAFSAVPPRKIQASASREEEFVPVGCPPLSGALIGLASFHAFDPHEKHAQLCLEVHSFFKAPATAAAAVKLTQELPDQGLCEVFTHGAGHSIPRKGPALTDLVKAFRGFIEKDFRAT